MKPRERRVLAGLLAVYAALAVAGFVLGVRYI